ncbi:CapA family protein [Sporosarcina sp. USHLN248]|uniref:CapA family protein n=1 Tax=Sporosarcina sp. USHLN248 TaxID=3081300 RepID=UPI00301B6B5C
MVRLISLFSLLMMAVGGCSYSEESIAMPKDFKPLYAKPIEYTIQADETTITVGMIGDVLLHNPLFTYDSYGVAFERVKEKLTEIDFLLANQESLPGGKELGLSGYPRFNSPKHIIRDLKASGVDMISLANNHILDQGEKGLTNALQHMNEYHMPYVGAYATEEDRAQQRIVEVSGIRIGVLSYTYGLNGMAIPDGKEYLVSLINKNNIMTDIDNMEGKVDIIAVSIHWGDEYALIPTDFQKELAKELSNAGADIIFGHHPHVLQKHEQIGHTSVFYSLGNFYSAQQFDSTNIGGIAKVEIHRTEYAGKCFIEVGTSTFYPTAVVRDKSHRYSVVPLREAGKRAIYNESWVERHVGLKAEK